MEQKIVKQLNFSEGTKRSIITILICWFILFSPWTSPLINFWWMISISSILISFLAGHFHPEWTLDLDVDKKNIVIGVGLSLLLGLLCNLCFQFLIDYTHIFQVHLDKIPWLYNDPTYFGLSIFLLLLMGQAEEIFWRGYIQQVFSEKWGLNKGYVLTVLLYTLMYVWSFNWILILGAFILSAILGGLCRINTRWLSPVMLAHALFNVFVFIVFPI